MKRFAAIAAIAAIAAVMLAGPGLAGSVEPREGWQVHDSEHSYAELIDSVKQAVADREMVVVTEAGPTEAAAKRGIDIPGNRVLGVFRNDFAVRVIRVSVPAMIEAPIRLYVTEDTDGTATLSYKTPSHVFAPYVDEGGEELEAIAAELDAIFVEIAEGAVGG